VSEQFLNGTSAQSGYTVPFTSVHAGKYVTEDKSKTDATKTKHNPEKANNAKYSRTKLPWFSRLIRHSVRKWGGLILQSSRAHTRHHHFRTGSLFRRVRTSITMHYALLQYSKWKARQRYSGRVSPMIRTCQLQSFITMWDDATISQLNYSSPTDQSVTQTNWSGLDKYTPKHWACMYDATRASCTLVSEALSINWKLEALTLWRPLLPYG